MITLEKRLEVKPLSANAMFWKRGKLTKKTSAYEAYQQEISNELKGLDWPFGIEQVSIDVIAGLSARQADLDNCLKPLLDTLQGIYEEFNDNKVYKIEARKEIVPKGEEYLWFRVRRFTEDLRDGETEVEGTESKPSDESKGTE